MLDLAGSIGCLPRSHVSRHPTRLPNLPAGESGSHGWATGHAPAKQRSGMLTLHAVYRPLPLMVPKLALPPATPLTDRATSLLPLLLLVGAPPLGFACGVCAYHFPHHQETDPKGNRRDGYNSWLVQPYNICRELQGIASANLRCCRRYSNRGTGVVPASCHPQSAETECENANQRGARLRNERIIRTPPVHGNS
jgi:hypothetical protein